MKRRLMRTCRDESMERSFADLMEKAPKENTILNVYHPLETVNEYLAGQDLTVQERDDTGCQHHCSAFIHKEPYRGG